MLVSVVHQHESAISIYVCPLSLEPSSHPIAPLQVVTEHQFELPASNSKFPLAIYFTYGNVYVFLLLSQFIDRSHPLLLLRCPQVFSLHLLLYPCPEKRFSSTVFLDSILRVNKQYLFFSFWLHSVTDSREHRYFDILSLFCFHTLVALKYAYIFLEMLPFKK